MSDSREVLLRVAGASAEVDTRLREVVGAATGQTIHYAPISDTNRGFDMQALGVAFDGIAAAVAMVALYFQLRDRDPERADDDLIDDAVARAVAAAGNAPEPSEAVETLRTAAQTEPGFVTVSIDTASYSIDVEAAVGVVAISVRPH